LTRPARVLRESAELGIGTPYPGIGSTAKMKVESGHQDVRQASSEHESAHLRALIECSSDFIWSVDLEWRLVTFNGAVAENFEKGRGIRAHAGMRPCDMFTAELAALWPPMYAQALERGAYRTEYISRDGRLMELSFNPITIRGEHVGVSVFGKDITERNLAENKIKASEARFRTLVENAPCAVGISRDGVTLYANRKYVEMFRVQDPSRLVGCHIREFWAPEWRERVENWGKRRMRGESAPTEYEGVGLREDGSQFPLHISVAVVDLPDGPASLGFLKDTTCEREAEKAVRESEARLRSYFDLQLMGMMVTSPEKEFLEINDKACQILGHPREELQKIRWSDITHPDDLEANVSLFERMKSGEIARFSLDKRFVRKDGSTIWTTISVGCVRRPDGSVDHVCTVIEDISERKTAEEAILKAEQEYRDIFEQAPEGIFKTAVNGKSLSMNAAGARMLGYASSEEATQLISDAAEQVWFCPEDRAHYAAELDRGEVVYDRQVQLKRKDGTPIWVLLTARKVRSRGGNEQYYQGYFENLSEQKRLEGELNEHLREVKLLSEMNSALVRARSEHELLEDYCRIIVETGGYCMAWVGIAKEQPEKRVVPMAWFGHEEGYLSKVKVMWDGSENSQGPTGRAVLSGRIEVAQDFGTDPALAPFHAEAAKRGYKSSIAVPFRVAANSMAYLTAYGVAHNVWSDAERRLMDQVASALGFGINTLRTTIAKEQYQRDLRASLEQTIQVIADTVDQRDPYTSGHQRRVANLCTEIARRLGLTCDRIHGLHLAASIHDLGKMGIPAEILSKPGKLTPIQYSLVKEHAQMGYEIIRGVQFPWPIADIVRQHHERLDGSGYPQGLKGDAILLEARILAVADVVEAMAMLRPYRAALGMEMALGQIISGRGTMYDATVVDACVRVFREDGHRFEA
jgi:PAS domain S-box-containing protein